MIHTSHTYTHTQRSEGSNDTYITHTHTHKGAKEVMIHTSHTHTHTHKGVKEVMIHTSHTYTHTQRSEGSNDTYITHTHTHTHTQRSEGSNDTYMTQSRQGGRRRGGGGGGGVNSRCERTKTGIITTCCTLLGSTWSTQQTDGGERSAPMASLKHRATAHDTLALNRRTQNEQSQ